MLSLWKPLGYVMESIIARCSRAESQPVEMKLGICVSNSSPGAETHCVVGESNV